MKETTLSKVDALIDRYPVLDACRTALAEAVKAICESYKQGGKLLVCGNGGSASDAAHIVGELMKSFILSRPVEESFRQKLLETDPQQGNRIAALLQGALPAIALTQESALLSAFMNDVSPELIYAQQVYGYGCAGDVLLCISTSGNSKNIVAAAIVAKAKGLHTIALTGRASSRLSEICDTSIQVPETDTNIVQELHLPVYHCLCAVLEQEFFGT